MKKIILSLTTAILFCVSGDTHANAWCDSCCYENSNPFYAQVFGGANFLQTEKNGGIKSDFCNGFIVSGSLGYSWCYGLRAEVEYAYRRNQLHKVHFFGRSFSVHGRFQSSSYMANLLWDMSLDNWFPCVQIKPFIGGGIGYDCQRISAHNSGLIFERNKRHFAWQIMAGLKYPVFCQTDISLEYKFHKGGYSHIYSHSVGIGLTYHFGS